jgi:CRISPR system Cascade subunit CasB
MDLVSDQATMILVQGLVNRANGRMPKDSDVDYGRLGIVAGVLACIDEDRGQAGEALEEDAGHREPIRETLAARLGRKADGGPPMSGLRFRQMQSATNPEDLLRLWRRALHLARKSADVATLGDDLYTWLLELDERHSSPSKSVRFHWAYDYYQQPRDKDAGGAPTPEAEAEG